MQYQNDAHRHRGMVKKHHRFGRIKGLAFLAVSIALSVYAIPAFATSVWDYPSETVTALGTVFSHDINDTAMETKTATAAAAKAEVAKAEAAKAESKKAESGAVESVAATVAKAVENGAKTVSETTGPGMLANESAVNSAKKRARALEAALAEQKSIANPQIEEVAEEAPAELSTSTIFASIAMGVALLCAILGVRIIMHGRVVRGRAITAAYGSALRAY